MVTSSTGHDKKSPGPVVLGIYLGHDQSCCLMRDGRVECAIEEERLNRYKHGRPRSLGGLWPRFSGKFGYFPWASVSYCLDAAHCELCEVDLIAIGDDQWAKEARETIKYIIPILDKAKVLYLDQPRDACHHFHHGLSSFHLSGFEEAAVLVIDGDGNLSEDGYEAETGFIMNRSGMWTQVFKNRYKEKAPPRSGIGWMYEQISYLLGFGNHEIGLAEPGKTMGLSSYGRPAKEFHEKWITADGFTLDFTGFKQWLMQTGYDRAVFGNDLKIASRFREPSAMAANLAYKVQSEAEDAIIHLAKTVRNETGASKLCLTGGVALNSVANGKLVRERIFDSVSIHPAVHDGGQSIGLAVHGHLLLTTPSFHSGMQVRGACGRRFEPQPIAPLESAYLGRRYEDSDVRNILAECDLPIEMLSEPELVESASAALAAGKFIGWFQGRSEIGPRALGNRSILACPTLSNVKDALNARVKFRERFRPFAPSVLEECCQEIFDVCSDSPYMLLVFDVRKSWIEKIPAVVHVDGSARLQTVNKGMNSLFYDLIKSLGAKTGVPVVLNTSFNLSGMPIVESPIDAICCFVQTQLDELYLGHARVKALDPKAMTYTLKAGWKVLTIIHGEQSPLTLSAPDRATTTLDCSVRLRRALALVDGKTTAQEIMERLELSEGDRYEFDALMKGLTRLGCLELKLGRHRISNTKHDTNWDKVLYEKSGSFV
jgi:carbamoyltransferase